MYLEFIRLERVNEVYLHLSETVIKRLYRVSLQNNFICSIDFENAYIDQDLFYRSGILCILECFVIPNGLPYYICYNIVLHSITKNLSIR